MNKRLLVLLCFILFIFSISCVSAENTTFSSLQTEINEASSSIELTHDYIYDNSTDWQLNQGILINKSDFILDGKGHTIDGAGQARIFNVTEYMIIKNLKLINGFSKEDGGAVFANDRVKFINVTFENNSAK